MLSKQMQAVVVDGALPTYAWPGAYPLYYLNNHSDVLCAVCANNHADYDETIVAQGANMEDESLTCDHCSKRIESACGD
jgi:hypothetical protein